MLSAADCLAVRGPKSTAEIVIRHLSLAQDMMVLFFAGEDAGPLPKLLSGDELIRELGLEPGPLVGRLLDYLREEQKLGNITSREEAIAVAADRLAAES